MPISSNASQEDKAFFFTERFKVMVRSQKELLKRTASLIALDKPYEVNAFRYDFYRLLRVNKVPSHLWWATAFINDVKDPTKDVQGITSFLLVNESVLDESIVRNNTRQG